MGFIKNWLRDNILTLHSYAIQNSDNKLKLDAMESPFVLSQELEKQLLEKLKSTHINRYPSSHNNLKQVVKNLMDIPPHLEIMFGNGSDELIQILMLGCENGDRVCSFAPSFVMYEMIAKWCKLDFFSIELIDNFEIDLEKTLKKIQEHSPKIIFIAYPNNPTGNNFNRNNIEKIIQNSNALVVIDEAYYAYSDDSFITDIDDYENVVVLRTISKIGFAGLRLGVMIGKSEVITEFNKLRMPYNINTLTMIASEFLLNKKEVIESNASIIKQQRGVVFDALNNYTQIKAYNSNANFILFQAEDSDTFFEFLKENGVLIKNIGDGLLRVTISTADENAIFLNLLNKFYG